MSLEQPSTAGEATRSYLDLPLLVQPDTDRLKAIFATLQSANKPQQRFLAASAAAEIATQVRPSKRTYWASQVSRIVGRLAETEEYGSVPAVALPRLSAVVPILQHGPTPEAIAITQRFAAVDLFDTGRRLRLLGEDPFADNVAGLAREQLTALPLNSDVPGMYALLSLWRQANGTSRVDGRPYRFGVTAFSDGRTIESGQYHLQVSPADTPHFAVHPGIVRVNFGETYDVDAAPATPVTVSVLQTVQDEWRSGQQPTLQAAASHLIGLLRQHGPSSPS